MNEANKHICIDCGRVFATKHALDKHLYGIEGNCKTIHTTEVQLTNEQVKNLAGKLHKSELQNIIHKKGDCNCKLDEVCKQCS